MGNSANAVIEKEEEPHYTGHRQRLRERFLASNSEAFPDYELLEILLFCSHPRGDVKPLAKALLKEFGSLKKVLSASSDLLAAFPKLGVSGAAALKAVQATCLRVLQEEVKEKPVLQSWKAILDYCNAAMGGLQNEQLRIFFLDKKLQLIADEVQQYGTIDHTPMYPREVAKRALELGASALILAHNHPSGDVKPSASDIEMTKRIGFACTALGIQLHDHLIIGAGTHYSFAGSGLL